MKRGEIWLVQFDPQVGSEIQKTRPAVIVSREPFNSRRLTITVVPLTTGHFQTVMPLLVSTPTSGKPSVAVIDQLKAIDKSRLVRKLGSLSSFEMSEISEALTDYLQLL